MNHAHNPLADEIRRRIAVAGPMPVSRYMELCLSHPEHGYYITRDPLGRDGDFTTAPEISQMFGELIGLWSASVWRLMGRPDRLNLVELGPGRGTLMMDALRSARIVPDFLEAVSVHLVEINPALREKQAQTLDKATVPLAWHEALDAVPEGPAIVIANEFFDALPVRQAIRVGEAWHERAIETGDDGALRFAHMPAPIPRFADLLPARLRDAPEGSVFEWRDDTMAMMLARRLRDHGGAALIFDYGHTASAIGDTFQALAKHAHADPLEAPGEADLTAHVDFEALAAAALTVGARVYGPAMQGEFLRSLGIENRALSLMAKAQHETAENIASGLRRLTSTEDDGMGALFKVMGFAAPALSNLPALAEYVVPRRRPKTSAKARNAEIPAASPATPMDESSSTPAAKDTPDEAAPESTP